MDNLFLVSLLGVVLCCLGRVDASAYDKIVTHSRIRAKKEGPNVCALQQVMGTNKKYFSTCRNWYRGSICAKEATVLYECCPGYMKIDGMKGCPAVAPIDHIFGTLGTVKATTTQQYSELSNVKEDIEGNAVFTMFAPSDDAWDQLDPSTRSAMVANANTDLYSALQLHMVDGRLVTKDMKDGLTVTSMEGDQKLRINHYSNGVVTVNCARIIHGNQVATNGVVHVIDRVIVPASKTIKDYLEENEELSSFTTAASAANVLDKLGEPGHFTLFVPTDEAFNKLAPGYLESVIEDQDVITALVNYHLLNTVQCAEAIMAGTVYETVEGSTIEIGCDGDSLTVNGIKMVLKKDVFTSNGVVHLIDEVLLPDAAKEVTQLMGASQSTFKDLVSELGLSAEMRANLDYTVLAPLNEAFTDEVMATDQSDLKRILENHILKAKVSLNELYTGLLLETLSGKFLRTFIYRTAVCIENSCMLRGSKTGKNGALHLMGSLLKTSDRTLYQLLHADGRFKTFLSLMETAGLYHLLRTEGSLTIFAPTDEAFRSLSAEDLALLKSDMNVLRTILLYHISNGVFINGGLERGVTNLLKTRQGHNLQVKFVDNSVKVNSIVVPNSDLMATNGVIHIVNNVLYPEDLPVGREDLRGLLEKVVKDTSIKFVSGFSYAEIPQTEIDEETKAFEEMSSTGVPIKHKKVVEATPALTQVTRVVERPPALNKVTRVIDRKPGITKVTRVLSGGAARNRSATKVTGGGTSDAGGSEPQIIAGPDFSKIMSIRDNPSLFNEETGRITELIKAGRGNTKPQASVRRRAKFARSARN